MLPSPAGRPAKICGHDVFFPRDKEPFSAQKSVISKALSALNKGQNALLESPTGTGKTLALLTSTLSWQKKNYEDAMALYEQQHTQQKTEGMLKQEGSVSSGGAAASCEPAGWQTTSLKEEFSAGNGRRGAEGAPRRKRIYFCARTHSQLQQSVQELKHCHESYLDSLSMCVLSSRKNLCVNDDVLERSRQPRHSASFLSVDEGCQALLQESNCRFNNVHSIQRSGEELNKGKVWDIEDAAWMGRKHKSCPYFVSRKLHQAGPALTFAPYSYLLNSSIRQASAVQLRDSIVVFDEAHNIEDACREAASCEVHLSALRLLSTQLKHGSTQQACGYPVAYDALHGLVASLVKWLADTARLLEHSDLERGTDHIWAGDEVLALFAKEMQLTPSSLATFSEHLLQVIAAEEEDERQALLDLRQEGGGQASYINIEYDNELQEQEEGLVVGGSSGGGMKKKGILTTLSLLLLKDLFRIFDYMLRDEAKCIDAYKLVVLKHKRGKEWDTTLNLWCLSASVAFSDFSECHSIILSSGTLSPLDSFSAELGVEFAVRVEAKHVIDTDAQVFATAISKLGNVDLKCTFHFHDDVRYQDALGNSLLAIRQASSAGMLVFFPSYGLLDKMTQRWGLTGLMAALGGSGKDVPAESKSDDQGRAVVVEPRDGKELEGALADYNRRINAGLKGVLLAVCRGKVSEGIDFADEYARTVCMVGIPFPSVKDLQVRLKRSHQDELCKKYPSSGNLPGDKWYCQEAFRAVNQAVGRCIRHMKDFGAIILLDSRFALPDNQAQMSKWLRGRITSHDQLGDVLVGLRSFTHTNRLKFAEHLSAWRLRRAPALTSPAPVFTQKPGFARAGRSSTQLSRVATSDCGGGIDGDSSGMSGKQRAVISMFRRDTRMGKTSAKQTHPISSPEQGTTPNYKAGGNRLSDFTLDFFHADSAAPSSLQGMAAADMDSVLAQAGAWRLRAECLTRAVPSSTEALFGLDLSLQLSDLRAVKLPPELSHLRRHLFRRDHTFLTDSLSSVPATGGSSSKYTVPLDSAMYAVSLQSWSWDEQAAGKKELSRWSVREVWVPEDVAAYRLLEYTAMGCSSTTPRVLCAATVIGASKRCMAHLDQSWINIELLLLLLHHPTSRAGFLGVENMQRAGKGPDEQEEHDDVERSEGGPDCHENTKREEDCDGWLNDDVFSVCTQQMEVSPVASPDDCKPGHVQGGESVRGGNGMGGGCDGRDAQTSVCSCDELESTMSSPTARICGWNDEERQDDSDDDFIDTRSARHGVQRPRKKRRADKKYL